MRRLFIAAIAATALLGLPACTSQMNAGYQAVYTEGKTAVQTFNDNAVQGWLDAGCALPYGAVVRDQVQHPNLGVIMPAACGSLVPPLQAPTVPVPLAAPVPTAAPPVPVSTGPAP